MLAQNFKTAADLGITDEQFAALRTLLGMLERGEIPHAHLNALDLCRLARSDETPSTFNLAAWHCGTAACLGGWAEYVGGVKFERECGERKSWVPLFFPDDSPRLGLSLSNMLAISPAQAAVALRNYLTEGKPRWREALAA